MASGKRLGSKHPSTSTAPQVPKKTNIALDSHIGGRVKLRRTVLGVTQQELAEAINVATQQIQKYENGINRLPASRLYEIAKRLDTPITFFYEGLGDLPSIDSCDMAAMKAILSPVGQDLIRGFSAMSPQARLRLVQFLREINRTSKDKGR